MRPKRAALYLRVSTGEQTVENQRRELEAAATARGWSVVARYADEGVSGAKGRDKRPGLDAMLRDAVRRKFDVLMVWSVDRIGRSLIDLISVLHELHGAGADLFLHQQALDTTTPAGKTMFGMLSVFAEFDRSMIQARVKAGMARIKAGAATKSGKPIGRPKISAETEQRIRDQLATGTGKGKTARLLGVGTGTVEKVARTLTADGAAR